MSIRALNTAIAADLQPIPKLVFIILANWCDSYGFSWPSIRKLTKVTGLSRSTVIKHLQALDAAGHLKIITRPNRSSLYLLAGCDEETLETPLPRDHPAYNWQLEAGPPHGPRPGDGPGGPGDGPLEVRETDPDTKGDTKETRVKRRCRLPEDWKPSGEDIDYAHKKGMTAEIFLDEAQAFKNYHLAKGTAMADWHRAWMTWVGNWAKWRKQSQRPSTLARPAI